MTPQELKSSILQLAVQGKLVEQRSEEGTGDELYQQIQEEKQRLIQTGKIKKEKPLPPITEDERPFDIPENWTVVRIGDVGVYKKGPFGSSITKNMFVPKGPESVKVYEQKNAIQKDHTLGEYYIKRSYFNEKMRSFEVFPGDVIVSCAGTIGETYVMPDGIEQGIINQALMRMKIVPSLNLQYFLMYFDYVLKKSAQGSSKGSAIKNIPPFDVFKKMILPLPPLAEQQRIVAKIEELLLLIDRYEEAWNKLEDFNKRFPEDMQKSLLQMAIRGKLVEQRPEEGTGEELYQQIQAEKQRLIKTGKIKKEKPLPEITEDEIPFDIPESWKWVRLQNIFQLINGDRGKNYPSKDKLLSDGEIPFISAINMENGTVKSDGLLFVSQTQYDLLRNGKLQKNDFVFCLRGSLGKFCRYPFEKGAVASSLIILRKYGKILDKFIEVYLASPLINAQIHESDNGTAQPNLGARDIAKYCVPIPPLAEQKRIVAKLEELLPLCERLK